MCLWKVLTQIYTNIFLRTFQNFLGLTIKAALYICITEQWSRAVVNAMYIAIPSTL